MSIPVLALLLAFSIISPLVGVVLILGILVGSNIGLRLIARVSRIRVVSYIGYVSVALGLVWLWLVSLISVIEVVAILVPITLAYWVMSWYKA